MKYVEQHLSQHQIVVAGGDQPYQGKGCHHNADLSIEIW